MKVDAIKGETCRAYYKQRRADLTARFPKRAAKALSSSVDGKGSSAFENTIRRELATLSAALAYCKEESHLIAPPAVWLPPAKRGKEQWLTRKEAAALIRAARNNPKTRHHLPLFILVGLYMGQRKQAILDLQWVRNFTGGFVDLEAGIIHWKAEQERDSNKRRPKSPIPKRLLRFLHYARKRTRQYVFERDLTENGGPMKLTSIGDIAHGFATAACVIGKGALEKIGRVRKARGGVLVPENVPHAEISPHILRHTCITWLLQKGVNIREVAGFVGATEQIIEGVYGHHHPEHMANAKHALD